MSYESLPIRLHAENVGINVQHVHITHCACHRQLEAVKELALENRELLKKIADLLEPEYAESSTLKLAAHGN